ncbi:MAG TPA: NfeD family protein [Acidimicrobiia bacterium]
MAESAEIARIVADCQRYWQATGVPRRAIAEMQVELERHLRDASTDGRSPTDVVGYDLADFAESWASEYRERPPAPSAWEDVTSGRAARRRANRRALLTYTAGALLLALGTVVGTGLAGGGERVDNEIWRWFWTIFAVGFGMGEIFTAGFFLFPFAVGAAVAAVLAWIGVNVVAQWLVFTGVSIIALVYLRRYATVSDAEQPRVGAYRLTDATGVVLVDIDAGTSSGMVRIESEEWRASSESGESIPAGTRITVTEVRGSRLIVRPAE